MADRSYITPITNNDMVIGHTEESAQCVMEFMQLIGLCNGEIYMNPRRTPNIESKPIKNYDDYVLCNEVYELIKAGKAPQGFKVLVENVENDRETWGPEGRGMYHCWQHEQNPEIPYMPHVVEKFVYKVSGFSIDRKYKLYNFYKKTTWDL